MSRMTVGANAAATRSEASVPIPLLHTSAPRLSTPVSPITAPLGERMVNAYQKEVQETAVLRSATRPLDMTHGGGVTIGRRR